MEYALFFSILGCWVSPSAVEQNPILPQPIVNSCELSSGGHCRIGDTIVVKTVRQHHKHLVDGQTHSQITLSISQDGTEREVSLNDSALEEKNNSLFIRYERTEPNDVVQIFWGPINDQVNESWVREQVIFPTECGLLTGISHLDQEGTWKIFSENECSEIWGGYSGMRIQHDHRYSGSCSFLTEEESTCPFEVTWEMLSGMAGNPPSSFVTIGGTLRWSDTETEFEFSLGDVTELIIKEMVVSLQMAENNEEILQVTYQPKRRTFHEKELKRRLSIPEYCGDVTSSETQTDFILFQTKKGCSATISKHTGNVLNTFFYIGE